MWRCVMERLRGGCGRGLVWLALVTGALSLLVGLLGKSAPVQAAVTGNVIPDPTVNTSSSGFNGTVVTSVVQTDGRIVIGGSFTAFNGIARNRIARLNSDGTLDPSYDPGAGFNEMVSTLALQPDGKVLAGGYFTTFNTVARGRIARLNTDGSLDTTFVPTGTGFGSSAVMAVAVRADGKVYAGGNFTAFNSTGRGGIARLNADGSLDTTFVPTGSGFNGSVYTLAVQGDGRVVVGGGFTGFGGTPRSRIARLYGDGSLDPTFNPGTGFDAHVNVVKLQADGRLVAAGGFTSFAGTSRNRVARLMVDGALDVSFSPGTGFDSYIMDVGIQADGTIVVGGDFSTFNGATRTRIARLNPFGNLDVSFDPGVGPNSLVNSVAVQQDGKVLLGGYFSNVSGVVRARYARLTSVGALDAEFHSGAGFNNGVYATAAQADGKVIAAGAFTDFNGMVRRGVARLTTNGALDPSLGNGTGPNSSVLALAALADGRILAAGTFSSFNGLARGRIVRLSADGVVDTTAFTGSGFNSTVRAIAVQPDGKVIAVGDFTTYNGTARNGVARLNADGTLDTAFNPQSGFNAATTTVALQTDGKIVVGGSFTLFNGVTRTRIARLNSDGSLDTAFDPVAGFNSFPVALAMQADGKIVVGGYFTLYNGVARSAIARLNANGTLDTTFNPGSGFNGVVRSVVLESDGAALVGGDFTTFNGMPRSRIARLNANGSLDLGFYPGAGLNGAVYSLSLLPSGKLAAGGLFTAFDGAPLQRIAVLLHAPSAPTVLPGLIPGNASITAPFTPPVITGGAVITNYEYALSVDNGTKWGAWTPRNPASTTSPITIGGLANGTAYRVKLRAVNAAGAGAESVMSSLVVPFTVPTAPTITSATPGNGTASIAFSPPASNGGAAITNYKYSLDNGVTWLTRSPTSTASPLQLAGLLNGHTYQVVLRALNLAGDGAASLPVSVTPRTVPDAPTGVAVAAVGTSSAVLSFTAPLSDGGAAVTNYEYALSIDNGATWASWLPLAPPDAVSPITIVGLVNGTTYRAKLRAVNAAGAGPESTMSSVFMPRTVPGAPTLTAAAPGNTVATITFTPPASDGGFPITNYKYSTDNGATWTTRSPASTTSPMTIQALANGHTYQVLLRAVNPVGDGAVSNMMTVTPRTVPEAPTALVATAGDASASIAFIPPAFDGGAAVVNYQYALSVDDGAMWASWVPLAPADGTSPVAIPGLANWTPYRVKLRAVNAAGVGAESAPSAPFTPAPVGMVFTAVTPARVVDTRLSSGGAGPVLPGTTGMRTFSVAATQSGGTPVVPAGATAIAYNLTVPNPAAAGHARVMPADAATLTTASAINFRPGETIANGLATRIDAQRRVTVYTGSAADVVIDVVGYFAPAPSPPTPGGRFTAVTPVRVYATSADTVAGALAAGGDRVVSTATTQDGVTPVVPAGAEAVAYNITVVRPTAGGHLRVMPGDTASSDSSTINWTVPGDVIANGITVKLDDQRRIKVHNSAGVPVDFLVDVVGYYSPSGALFYPTDPTRVLDTRTAQGGEGAIGSGTAEERSVGVGFAAADPHAQQVPAGATSIAYNLTVTAPAAAGHLRVRPAGTPLISASTINWPGPAYTRANATIVAISPDRQVTIYNGSSGPADALIDTLGYYR